MTNVFVHRSAARRYAAARPYFHPLVVRMIAAFTNTPHFGLALDVGSGTGQSTRALADIADRVEGIDISAQMIAEVQQHDRVRFQVAPAERIPSKNASFDLVTAGLAFHWFNQPAFLAEASRVLKPGGWLVVYTSGFNGEMVENPDFRQWAWDTYPKHFPTPPRRSIGVCAELVEPFGFSMSGKESFSHRETMTAEQLTDYLLTQTNVIAAVESGSTPIETAQAWIARGVKPYFADAYRTMLFSGSIWYLMLTQSS